MLDATRRSPALYDDGAAGDERVVYCRACKATVARHEDRVVTGGGELHTFVNPQGQVLELLCFARASGAVAIGEGTLAYTWFPGHAWRLALCRARGQARLALFAETCHACEGRGWRGPRSSEVDPRSSIA